MLINYEQIIARIDPRRVISGEEQMQRLYDSNLILCLLFAAQQAASKAISYRHFAVGCAVWAFKSQAYEIDDRWKIFTGANFKAREEWPTTCAELVACYASRNAGYDKIVAIAIVGEPQEDSESGVLSKTLRPCGKCRRALSVLPEINNELTRVICHNAQTGFTEDFRFDELLKLYPTEKGRVRKDE